MNIINPGYEMMKIPSADDKISVLKFLESIGRVCYKSEDKITEDSYLRYLKMLRDNKHWAMLEHYIFVLEVPEWMYYDLFDLDTCYEIDPLYNKHLSFFSRSRYTDKKKTKHFLVSFSITALNYLMEDVVKAELYINQELNKIYEDSLSHEYDGYNISNLIPCCTDDEKIYVQFHSAIHHLFSFMYEKYAEIVNVPDEYTVADSYDERIHILTNEEISLLSKRDQLIHGWTSVKFTVSRGFTHEIVRHRPASFAQESTRYCSYNKDKFGNEISYIKPSYLSDDNKSMSIWSDVMRVIEKEYMFLMNYKRTAQEARSILPNSLKTEIVVTTRFSEWIHIFDMRADKPAHPEMKEIMYPLLNDFISIWPMLFDDIKWRIKEGDKDGWL